MSSDIELKRSLALKCLNQRRHIRRLEDLLRKVRDKLAMESAVFEAELIDEIDEVIDANSTH